MYEVPLHVAQIVNAEQLQLHMPVQHGSFQMYYYYHYYYYYYY